MEHEELVELGVNILRDMGFRDEQIKKEYYFPLKKFSRESDKKYYKIDVAGISQHWEEPHLWVAIECGVVKKKKIIELRKYFDYVIKIPYNFSYKGEK